MALWGKINRANNAPKYQVVESQVAFSASRGSNTLFNNVTVGVFHSKQLLGVWGANATQVAATEKITHTGWHYVRQGTGSVGTLTITAGGTGFANLSVGTITSPGAGGNASFYATTNATGGLTSLTLTSRGHSFINSTATITAPANGIINVAIGGGTGYSNADTIVFSNGQVNATATLMTNATGGIANVTIVSAGRGFPSNTGTVVTITTTGGTNGNVVVNALGAGSGHTLAYTAGGRAGRLHYECLVAGEITGSPPATLP